MKSLIYQLLINVSSGRSNWILPPNSPKNLSLKCQLSLNTEGMLDVEASEPLGKKVKAAFNIRVL